MKNLKKTFIAIFFAILLAAITAEKSNAETLDIDAPANISNLAVSEVASYSAILIWTAPGDDASVGIASSYDIRYSTSNITESVWPSAIKINNAPIPSIAKTNQTVIVSGLNPGTTYYFAIKTSDEAANISKLSNVVNIKTLGIDAIAPSAITNLAASVATLNSVNLIWTASGDDAKVGTASSYDIRYSTAALNENTWATATKYSGYAYPQISGTNQNVTIYNLNQETTYYFAIKSSDEALNASKISNVISVKTLSPEDTTPPGVVKEFVVKNKTAASGNALGSWANPNDKDFLKVLVMRSEDAYPKGANDGIKIYEGGGTQFDDNKTIEGKIYYYNIFAFDKSGMHSTGIQKIFFTNNTLIKKIGDDKIYAVINGEKKWIATSAIFNRKKYDWKNIRTISKDIFDNIKTGENLTDDDKIKLIKGKNDPRVYVIKGDKKFWVPTAEAFNKSGYKWKDIANVNDGEVIGYGDVKLAKEENNDTIYYLCANSGIKKSITSAKVFLSYPSNKWEDIEILTQAELDSYENARLIRKSGDYKVYYLDDNGSKRLIPSLKIFNARKFNWNKVVEINETELNSYIAGPDLE